MAVNPRARERPRGETVRHTSNSLMDTFLQNGELILYLPALHFSRCCVVLEFDAEFCRLIFTECFALSLIILVCTNVVLCAPSK